MNPHPQTESTKLKISLALKGRKKSEEHKQRLSTSRIGRFSGVNSPRFGKPNPSAIIASMAAKEKLRVRHDTSVAMRAMFKVPHPRKTVTVDVTNPMYGRRGPLSPSYGKPRSLAVREKISLGMRKRYPFRYSKLAKLIRVNTRMDEWRRVVFVRDNYRCQECGATRGINAHHLIPLHKLVKEYEIMTLEDAIACPMIWDVSNGQTLCRPCHELTDSFGPPKIFQEMPDY